MTFLFAQSFSHGTIQEKEGIRMIFKEWLKQHKDDPSAIGDIAKDMLADPHFTESQKKEDILEYLQKAGAIQDALDAFNLAWKEYSREQKR